MRASMARVFEPGPPPQRRWWVWSRPLLTKGGPGEPAKAVRLRHEQAAGVKITELTRYRGVMRPSEAAMTAAADRRLSENPTPPGESPADSPG